MSREPNRRRAALPTGPRIVHWTPNDYARTWRLRVGATGELLAVLGYWDVDPAYDPSQPFHEVAGDVPRFRALYGSGPFVGEPEATP